MNLERDAYLPKEAFAIETLVNHIGVDFSVAIASFEFEVDEFPIGVGKI